MSSQIFELGVLLSLKDAASGGLDRFSAKLRSMGNDGATALQELNKIRANLNRDLAIGGVGVAGMSALYKGVEAAGDFQAVMTDLSSSLTTVGKDGKVNFDALGKDMLRAEAIAVRLGNSLPGTISDYAAEIQSLKQNGLDTETILNGAAEAVGHLAVANNALPKDIAADFAQYGNLFKLKPQEFSGAADVFSRIYSSTSQTSAELIEAAKYFEGRAGTSLGIGGLKDAEQITRLFGMFGMKGMRGSIAGTMLTDFFHEYEKHADRIKELQKDTGIKLDFFDSKGKFAGMDTVFEQMKQFDKLSDKDRSGWLDKIFGLRGMSAANVFAQEGIEGWKKFNSEQDKTISLSDKVEKKSATFNNQLENLQGTLSNLEVTVFSPMLPDLTSGINSVNNLVGSIQEFSKAHPDLSKGIVELAAYGSTALTVYSAFNLLSGGIKLFKLVSSFSTNEGLLPYLSRAKEEATQTTFRVAGFARPLDEAAEKAGEVENKFARLKGMGGAVKFGVAVVGIAAAEYAITSFAQMVAEQNQRTEDFLETAKQINRQYDRMAGLNLLYNKPGDYGGQKGEFDKQAASFLKKISEGRTLQAALHPESKSWWEYFSLPNPYLHTDESGNRGTPFDVNEAASYWKGKGVTRELQDPNVLARIVDLTQRGGGELNLNTGDISKMLELYEKVTSKDKMATVYDILAKEHGQNPQSKAPVTPFYQLFQSPNLPKIQAVAPLDKFQKPLPPPTMFGTPPLIKGFDNISLFNKQIPTLTSGLQGFEPIINNTKQTFTGLQTAGGDWENSLLRIKGTTDDTQKGLDDFRQRLNETQPSLFKLVSSVNSVADSLNSASGRISSLEISAPKAIQNSFTPHSNSGIGVFTSLRESNRRDAEKRKIQHADLIQTAAANNRKENSAGTMTIHYAPVTNIHGNADKKDVEAANRRHLLEFEAKLARLVQRRSDKA